jgi:GTP-binding protein Era
MPKRSASLAEVALILERRSRMNRPLKQIAESVRHYTVTQASGKHSSGPYRCGYIALAGKPNVGKSTLLNALVGSHLSIVTAKPQTTRERVNGIVTGEAYQALFVDAPGLIAPRYALQESMQAAAATALEEADVVAFICDATRPETLPDRAWGIELERTKAPIIVALNKTDLVEPKAIPVLLAQAAARGRQSLAISAATGMGLDEFMERVVELLPESPPLFPVEDSATQPLRFFVGEYVRETCLDLFYDEVPYSIACRVDEFRESGDPIFIRVVVYVERDSQKGILIGKGGSTIKRVGELSRLKIEELVGSQVYLELRVKVVAGWRRKRDKLKQLGFPVPGTH